MVRSAVVGGVLLAAIEGLALFMQKKMMEYQKAVQRAQWEAIHGVPMPESVDRLDPPIPPPVWSGAVDTEEGGVDLSGSDLSLAGLER